MAHYIEKCKHGKVVGQCRCPSKDKVERLVDCVDPECRVIKLTEHEALRFVETMANPPAPNENLMKAWIDNATYEQLLRKWRNAPSGDPYFQYDLGKYYADVMAKRKAEVGHAEHVRTSKHIG